MVFFKNAIPLAIISISIFYLSLVEVSSLVISDDRARNLDVTPVLGRGYSLGTNSFQSTCLGVEEMTTPSYNYDYMFSSLQGKTEVDGQSAIASSFAYEKVKDRLTKQTKNSYLIIATMRIERYYNSLREESSPLTDDAATLLDNQDYIGFFKSCGPNYVRSIRRAQELTALFQYSSSSEAAAKAFEAGLKNSGMVGEKGGDKFEFAGQTKFKSVTNSLEITIIGYGLGLNHEGSGSLTSTTLAEFNTVMKFAFKSFTTSENANFVGMIYGIEIVPWVESTTFQVASKLGDEDIVIPIGKSLIPRVIPRVPGSDATFTNDEDGRSNFKCKNGPFYMDKYGYCCEGTYLYNTLTNEYEEEAFNVTSSTMICKPSRSLDKSMVKNNMINNAEFVARLDSIVGYRLNTLTTLEQCASSINTFDSRFYPNLLKAQATSKSDVLTYRITVLELKMALDPFNDYSLITRMGNELDEFLEMFYQPCIAALFGANIGTTPDVEPMYFMAYSWLQHPECSKISCLADNMRWDRVNGGCVASVLTGNSQDIADSTTDVNCKRNDEDQCEYTSVDIAAFQTATATCWSGQVSPVALMRSFCMPQLTSDKVDGATATRQLEEQQACSDAAP